MIAPFYMIIVIPPILVQSPGVEFTPALSLVPVLNVIMMFREAISGVFQWRLVAVTIGVELITVILCLWLARAILRVEDFLVGSHSGSLARFCIDRLLRRRKRPRAGATPRADR